MAYPRQFSAEAANRIDAARVQARRRLVRYAKRRGNFVLVVLSGGLQPHGIHEFVQVIDHALIELIQLGALLLLQLAITRKRL